MKRNLMLAFGMVAVLTMTTGVRAEWLENVTSADHDPACEECQNYGLFMGAELLAFRYTRADGTRVGTDAGEDVPGDDFLLAPRMTAGWVAPGGLGARVRWFEYDQQLPTINAGTEELVVDAYTIDVELFERFQLNHKWSAEFSGGLRYTGFDEVMVDPVESRINSIDAWGGVMGVEALRSLGGLGNFYMRTRGSVSRDDKFVSNEQAGFAAESQLLRNATVGTVELAMGYEYRRNMNYSQFVARAGWEWQNWHNFSSSFIGPTSRANETPGNVGENEHVFTGPADVGFEGFTFMVGWER